ncbi:ABC transporter substrate-binding protein [Arthrobacter ginkgonis]|uniref:ABC transporter substrate-binding protein n=1 Tax=Arthrobacter ginkgonis TaxID=1630594 RepID=A0ABP7BP84_9MICC
MKWSTPRRTVAARTTLLTGLAVASLALAGCAGGGGTATAGGAAAGNADVLNVQFNGPPITGLDPAKSGGGGSLIYNTPAYDSLIFRQPDGTLVPGLATEWGFTNDALTKFELTIRDGVKFSDGTELTAEGVAEWLAYFKDAKATQSSMLAAMTKAEAVNDTTVRITLDSPNPDLPVILSQQYAAGLVAAPAGMDKPGSLDAATIGTGPYQLDPAATVTGDHYTYVPNPNYWNPNGIVYQKVVVTVVSDPNTVVSALSSGQLDFALGKPETAEAAAKAGAEVLAAPGRVVGLYLLDREGTMVPELGSEKVRQAINYAIDRAGITTALYGDEYADPTSQMGLPLQTGFNEALDGYYGYDIDKAKALLAEAGYANGFTFEVTCSKNLNTCPVAQAIASSVADAGITIKINEESEISSFNQKFAAGEVPAVIFQSSGPAYNSARGLTQRDVLANPFGTVDEEIDAQYKVVQTTTDEEQGKAYSELVELLAEKAWFAPVVRPYSVQYVKGVDNVTMEPEFPGYYSLIDPTGKFTWKPAS